VTGSENQGKIRLEEQKRRLFGEDRRPMKVRLTIAILLAGLLIAPPLIGRGQQSGVQWPGAPKRFALLVGVNSYDDPQITPLIGPSNDMRALEDALVNHSDGRAWIDGPSRDSARVSRGGGWYSIAVGCLSANRSGDAPGDRSSALGFRLLRTYR
jgi:hypothetical protein